MMMMGMHTTGQNLDTTRKMMVRTGISKIPVKRRMIMGMHRKSGMWVMANNGGHKIGGHNMMGMMGMMGMLATNCGGLTGNQLGRCRAKIQGGCVGLMGPALKRCKAHRRRLRTLTVSGAWALVKKKNGQCVCTQNPTGQIVIGRFHSSKECETHRAHDC